MFLEEKYSRQTNIVPRVVTGYGGGGGGGGPNRSKLIVFLGLASLYFLNRRFI